MTKEICIVRLRSRPGNGMSCVTNIKIVGHNAICLWRGSYPMHSVRMYGSQESFQSVLVYIFEGLGPSCMVKYI